MRSVRAAFEHVVPTAASSWRLFVRREPRFDFQWHFHHEYELTWITGGSGTRIVGDRVEGYGPGDLTLIGPELPHTYVSTPGPDGQQAVVAQFRRDFLGRDLFECPEFGAVRDLLGRAARGLAFPPGAADPAALTCLPPADRTLELLRLLVRLAGHPGARTLAGDRHTPPLDRAAGDRIDAMVGLMHAAYARPLGLDEIARAAHLSPTSASRFFRRSTGTTITAYLNRLRIEAACHLLRDTDRPVAGIAADCGYASLANFNRRFRELKDASPREFRRNFRTGAVPQG
ncbi:AraC family transcriptional regulator [Actinacidiphila sp. ITFR-21]|uniref:AraC family transcriptional regulator n=1 Tax=Actinacidiphila sp. ITFR-21 TaxID=3075199 RepID=UPI00288BB7E5|nr:AraC family transcriptional regulator [Streptomyces sp. ITFR-21]WNI14842.1 AraC family transcriptional regulator [Streptomyces sp. ITFR-21]